MNEIAMIDKNLSVERTPEVIALEINSITENLRKIFLLNSIEIGRKLAEAKTMLPHGEWGNWLKKSFDYSQRTASYLMGIFEQYGSSQMVIFCDNAKSKSFAKLSYTQAVLLMGIPMEAREDFIEEHDIDSMTTRQLKQAIKEKQELETKLWAAENAKKMAESEREDAKKEAEATDQSLNDLTDSYTELQEALLKSNKQAELERQSAQKVSDSYDRLEKVNKEHYETAERLREELKAAQVSGNNDEVERLKGSLEKTNSELAVSLSKIEELERQLNEEPIEVTAAEVVEKIPDETEKELNELRERNRELEDKVLQPSQPAETSTDRFKCHFDLLVNGFRDLLSVLGEIDANTREKYKNAVVVLINKMSDSL